VQRGCADSAFANPRTTTCGKGKTPKPIASGRLSVLKRKKKEKRNIAGFDGDRENGRGPFWWGGGREKGGGHVETKLKRGESPGQWSSAPVTQMRGGGGSKIITLSRNPHQGTERRN